MPSVSITRLRVRGALRMPSFMWHALRSSGQAQRAAGYLDGGTATESGLVFWTVTVWQDAEAMRAFRNSGAHMQAMRRLIDMCSEASYGHWDQATPELPPLSDMHVKMRELGKLSKVRAASPLHASGATTSDRAPAKLRRMPPK